MTVLVVIQSLLTLVLVLRFLRFVITKHKSIMPLLRIPGYNSGDDIIEFCTLDRLNIVLLIVFFVNLFILMGFDN